MISGKAAGAREVHPRALASLLSDYCFPIKMETCSRIFHLIVFCYLMQVALEEPLATDWENKLQAQVQTSARVSAHRYNLRDRGMLVRLPEVCFHSPPQCSQILITRT